MQNIVKRRVIPCILIQNGMMIRSEGFNEHKIIGNPVSQAARYTDWNVDELFYIDISDGAKYDFGRDDHKFNSSGIKNRFDMIFELSKHCNMPLGFGGGIRTINDIGEIISKGADKVILNSVLRGNHDFVSEAANIFGSQAIVACVDYKKDGYIYHFNGQMKYDMKVPEYCKMLEDKGIGEIVLQSIERDGKAEGCDIETIANLSRNINVPLVSLGGIGNEFDFVEVLTQTEADVAAANWFHFKEQSYALAKKTIFESGFTNIRYSKI